MLKPAFSDKLDFEGEVAIVIGTAGRHIREEDALQHVAGYSCYNDGSVRDWQYHTSQFLPGKNFVATGGFGPWLATSDEIPDPTVLTLAEEPEVARPADRASLDQLIAGLVLPPPNVDEERVFKDFARERLRRIRARIE